MVTGNRTKNSITPVKPSLLTAKRFIEKLKSCEGEKRAIDLWE